MVEVAGVSEQLGRLSIDDVYGVSACRPVLHPSREGWVLASAERYIVAWEWRSSQRCVLAGHLDPVQAFVFADNGNMLFSTDGVDFIAWCGTSWREQLRAPRWIAGAGKDPQGRIVWQMCCLGGDRLIATAEGPSLAVGRGTEGGHVIRVWDPQRDFKLLAEHSLSLNEAPPHSPIQLLSLPGAFEAVAVTPWVIASIRYDSMLDVNQRDLSMADARERVSPMTRRWDVKCAAGAEFVGAMAGPSNSFIVLSSAGELVVVDNVRGQEVKRERLAPDSLLPCTSCHSSGALLCFGSLSGGISILNMARGANLSPVCTLMMDPHAHRKIVGRSAGHRHAADGIVVVPQWGPARQGRSNGSCLSLPGVVSVAISDQHRVCVTLSEDLAMRVIDVSNRQLSAALWAHHGEVTCLAVVGTPLGAAAVISGARDDLLLISDLARRQTPTLSSFPGAHDGMVGAGSRWWSVSIDRSNNPVADGRSVGNGGTGGGFGSDPGSGGLHASSIRQAWSLGEGKAVDLAALMDPSLSFCHKFRRSNKARGEEAFRHQLAGAALADPNSPNSPTPTRSTTSSMGAACLAVHPGRSCVACGTAAGMLVVIELQGGTVVQQRSFGDNSPVLGLAYSPTGRWLAARTASGYVSLLDGVCAYRRVCHVQDLRNDSRAGAAEGAAVDGGLAEEGYWPRWAHEVLCFGDSLSAAAGSHCSASVVHIVTRLSLRALAVYRVNAASAESALLYSVPLASMPAHVVAHPSGHYVFILDRNQEHDPRDHAVGAGSSTRRTSAPEAQGGRVELLHLMSKKFKGAFAVPAATHLITVDPSGLFVASVHCIGASAGRTSAAGDLQSGSSVWPVRAASTQGSANHRDERAGGGASRARHLHSKVSIWCAMSGDLRAHVGGLPAQVTQMAFVPDSSALVVGVQGGQLLLLGLPSSLRAEARRVLFGRAEGMHGKTLQEFWLSRPIDMQLARTHRLNRSLADMAAAACRLQAPARRAIDPIGPCIHLARVLLPILQRNAAVRFYNDLRDGTLAARRLQAAGRRVTAQRRHLTCWCAALDLQRSIRSLLALRQYEESVCRQDRAAAAAMSAHGDPSGWGLWDLAADSCLMSIPLQLLRTGQFEAVQRTLSILFLSRLIEAQGVQAALLVLRRAAAALRAATRTRRSFSGRQMKDEELDLVETIGQRIMGLLDLVSASSATLASIYRRRSCSDAGMDDGRKGSQRRGGAGGGGALDVRAGFLGWGGESLAGLADERSSSDGRLLWSVRVLRRSIGRVTERAIFLLNRCNSTEVYVISLATALDANRARQALHSRIGPQAIDVWARLCAKGIAHNEGGVLRVCSMQEMADALLDPCTPLVFRDAIASTRWHQSAPLLPGAAGAAPRYEADLSAFALQVLACLAAVPVVAAARDLQIKVQVVLRLGAGLEETLKMRRLEMELGRLVVAQPVRQSVLADHMRVLGEGCLPRDEAQKHLGYLLEGQLEPLRCSREYLRLDVEVGASARGGAGEPEHASLVRSRVSAWLKQLYNRGDRAGREAAPLMQVVRLEHDPTQANTLSCTIAVSPDPRRALASLASEDSCLQDSCDLRGAVDGIVEEFGRAGSGFGGLKVRGLARYEGSVFLQMLSVVPGGEGGLLEGGDLSQALQGDEMYKIFAAHARQTLAVEHPEWQDGLVEDEVETRWRAHCYSMFEKEQLQYAPLLLTAARVTLQVQSEGGDGEWEQSEELVIRLPDGHYLPGQLAESFNYACMMERQRADEASDAPTPSITGQGPRQGASGQASSIARMQVELGGSTGVAARILSARKFRLQGSDQVMTALGLVPGPDGRCTSVPAETRGQWEVRGSGLEAGSGSWRVPRTRAGVARHWIARQLVRGVAAATGLPARCIRVVCCREDAVHSHGGFVRTTLELLSSRDVPMAVIRRACDALLCAFHHRSSGRSAPPQPQLSDALSRVLSLSVSEGMVPPTRARMWQTAGPYVLASAADIQAEALQLRRMVLPALRHSLARQRVDLRWAGVPSPFCADLRRAEGSDLTRCLAYLDSHRLPGGSAYVERCGPCFFVGILAELVEPIDPDAAVPHDPTLLSGSACAAKYRSMGSVGVQAGVALLQSAGAEEAFVLLRDPKFMLSSAFKSVMQQEAVKRCFTERSPDVLQASKDLKRRVLDALGCDRAVCYTVQYRGHEMDVDAALRALDRLRTRLHMCGELRPSSADPGGHSAGFGLAERELRLQLRGAHRHLLQHFNWTHDQRLRPVIEDDVLRAMCKGADQAEGTVAKVDELPDKPSRIAAQGVRLDVEEAMALVFSCVSNTVDVACEAAALEQPLHHHLVWLEQQQALLLHHAAHCVDLRGRDATLDAQPTGAQPHDGAASSESCRAHVFDRLDDATSGDARTRPPILLLEGPESCGKTATLAQWLTSRPDGLVAPLVVHGASAGALAGTRHVMAFAFGAAMSIDALMLHLAIQVDLQWHGSGNAQHACAPGARLDRDFNALLSSTNTAVSVDACAQVLRQTMFEVAARGGRVLLAVDGVPDESAMLLSEVVRRCHWDLLHSPQYRALADLEEGDESRDHGGSLQQGNKLIDKHAAAQVAEPESVRRAREQVQRCAESVQAVEAEIAAGVTSTQTLQDWQRFETKRAELDERLNELRGELGRAELALQVALSQARETGGATFDATEALGTVDVPLAGSPTRHLGYARIILTRRSTVGVGAGGQQANKAAQKTDNHPASAAQVLDALSQEYQAASRLTIPPLTPGEAGILSSAILKRAGLKTQPDSVARAIAAKAGAVSPLYLILAAHEVELLPVVTVEALSVLPDSVEQLWWGRGGGEQRGAAAGRTRPPAPAERGRAPTATQVKPVAFGKERLAAEYGEPMLRAVFCALLEGSCGGSEEAYGATQSVLRDRVRDAIEEQRHTPVAVVSRGGWLFVRRQGSASSPYGAPNQAAQHMTQLEELEELVPGSLPLPCKISGVPGLLLHYDRQSGLFEVQGVGSGWPPGLILDLQPHFLDGTARDDLYDKVDDLIWELVEMRLVRAERTGTGGGEAVFFAEHLPLLSNLGGPSG